MYMCILNYEIKIITSDSKHNLIKLLRLAELKLRLEYGDLSVSLIF